MAISDYLKDIQHIGIPTKDIEATTEFYSSLGFKLLEEVCNDEGQAVCRFLGLYHTVIETYVLPEIKGFPGAIDHIALDVVDIEGLYAEIKQAGIYELEEDWINDLPQLWEKGCRYFKIIGPSAEIVEFCEIL